MLDQPSKTRRDLILDAAFETVGRYGYKRTSMDDIAKAAGISRPALYQEFKNKADIYRAGVQRYSGEKLTAIGEVLNGDQSIVERLREAFEIGVVAPHRLFESMPHGEELLGLKGEIAPDLMADWLNDMGKQIGQALAREPDIVPKRATNLAATIINAITGIKARQMSADEAKDELEKLLAVLWP